MLIIDIRASTTIAESLGEVRFLAFLNRFVTDLSPYRSPSWRQAARRFSEKVQKAYVRHVRTFTAFLGRSPDTATSEDLRRFQLHMAQQQISAGSINAAIAALRFLFNVTLERPDLARPLATVNKPRKAPVVLSQEEVARLLEAAPGLSNSPMI